MLGSAVRLLLDVVCSRGSFSRRNGECLILEHQRVFFQLLTLDWDAPLGEEQS